MSTAMFPKHELPMYDARATDLVSGPLRCFCYCFIDSVEMMLTVVGHSVHMSPYSPTTPLNLMENTSYRIAGSVGASGMRQGPGDVALFHNITDMCVDRDNILILCDFSNALVRMMDLNPPYTVETLCGSSSSYSEGLSFVRFVLPRSVCVDVHNNLFVLDVMLNTVYRIDSTRNHVSTFFDNSMVDAAYYGNIALRSSSYMKDPLKIRVQQDRNLIILNRSSTLIKVSLRPSQKEGVVWCTSLQHNLGKVYGFDTALNGDIVVCQAKGSDCIAFYKISPQGDQQHIANLHSPNDNDVMDLAVCKNSVAHPYCFRTLREIPGSFTMNTCIMQTNLTLKWESLRVLFIACLKPDTNTYDDDHDKVPKTFELLPVSGTRGQYSPILRLIVDFVNSPL